MAAHAAADHRDFGDVGGAVEPCVTDPVFRAGDGIARADIFGSRHREGQVGGRAVLRDVLHDHVDIDVGVRQRTEDRRGNAGLVLDLADGNLRLVLGEGYSGDDVAFHDFLLAADQRARRGAARIDILGLVETRPDEHRHVVYHAKLDRADLQHLGALRRQLQHVLERDSVEPARLRHHPRVGRIDAVDVGIDVAAHRVDGGGNRYRRGVGAAASQRGDAAGLRIDSLEAGDDGDFLTLPEAVDQLGTVDFEDPRRGMGVAGPDRDLPALPRTRLDAEALQHDCQKTRGDLLAGCHYRVIFARVMHRRRFATPLDEFVGLAGHRRDHDGDVMAGVDLAFDMARDVADPVDIGDRGAAEFHHKAAHDAWRIPWRGR